MLEIDNAAKGTVTTKLTIGKGAILGNVVRKLNAASKYGIKTASGIAGVRGTIYSAGSDGSLVVAKGEVSFTSDQTDDSELITVKSGKRFRPRDDKTPKSAPDTLLSVIMVQAAQLAKNAGVNTGESSKAAGIQNPSDNSTSGN